MKLAIQAWKKKVAVLAQMLHGDVVTFLEVLQCSEVALLQPVQQLLVDSKGLLKALKSQMRLRA